MWRFVLALKCFFLVLFARRLPPEAIRLLPPPSLEPPAELPPPEGQLVSQPPPVAAPTTPPSPPVDDGAKLQRGAILLLGVLQREGRLLDFLEEDIESYGDAQIGAAVRDIHRGCRRALAEYVQVEPVLREPDNATVKVEKGFDPSRIRLVGNVAGQPPFTGTLRHPGWRGVSVKLPELPANHDPSVITPAEVEL